MDKSTKIEKKGILYDNRGASMLVVLALFVILSVVAMNMLMLADAGERTAVQEYETEQRELCLYSIYEVLNGQLIQGTWNDAFVQGETVEISADGFQDTNGTAIPVIMKLTLERNLANLEYCVTYEGEVYRLTAKYIYYNTGGAITITLKSCGEWIHE